MEQVDGAFSSMIWRVFGRISPPEYIKQKAGDYENKYLEDVDLESSKSPDRNANMRTKSATYSSKDETIRPVRESKTEDRLNASTRNSNTQKSKSIEYSDRNSMNRKDHSETGRRQKGHLKDAMQDLNGLDGHYVRLLQKVDKELDDLDLERITHVDDKTGRHYGFDAYGVKR